MGRDGGDLGGKRKVVWVWFEREVDVEVDVDVITYMLPWCVMIVLLLMDMYMDIYTIV
jgi:hypothetical protein